MDIKKLQDRYNQLLDEEADLVDTLYDLELEEMDFKYEEHCDQIREAKQKVGARYDLWWKTNEAEYMSLRKQINGC